MVPAPALAPAFTLHVCLIRENLLSLLWSGGTTKNIKGDIKPTVNVSVDDMVLVTDLLGGETLLHSLGLCCCTIFICPAHIEGVPLAEAGIPGREYGGGMCVGGISVPPHAPRTPPACTLETSYFLGPTAPSGLPHSTWLHLAKTSALSTQPMMFPRWGTLLT